MSLSCFHCGESVPDGFDVTIHYQETDQPVCCFGCEAVANTILQNGMEDYYRYRTETADKATQLIPESLKELTAFDDQELNQAFLGHHEGLDEVTLSVEGISCAACSWLIEKQLGQQEAITEVNVNITSQRLHIKWHQDQLKLSEILQQIAKIGYKAYPFQVNEEEQIKQKQNKQFIMRLGLGGLMTMQVMMIAIALYFGVVDPNHENFLRGVSLILSAPVVLYAALPFLFSALRALRARHLNMDVPVSIAIYGAFAASAWATFQGKGEVYFESVCMFTFLLLLGKYLEFRTRLQATEISSNLLKLIPFSAIKLTPDGEVSIPAQKLIIGDVIRVSPGATISADGEVIEGQSSNDESMFTGEFDAVRKITGDEVFAGAVNHDGILNIRVSKEPQEQLIRRIIHLQDQATIEKPRMGQIADKISVYFVAVLLCIATLTAIGWSIYSPDDAFWVTLSVLVATCPCALSLATPAALTCGTSQLNRHGILVKKGHVIESANQLTDVCFDKTGTLTEGEVSFRDIQCLSNDYDQDELLNLAANIETASEHPIAKAFRPYLTKVEQCEQIQSHIGKGITALWHGKEVIIGKPSWVDSNTTLDADILIKINNQLVMQLKVKDATREDTPALLSWLKSNGITPHMLTGDQQKNANRFAQEMGISHYQGNCSPEDKVAYVQSLIAKPLKSNKSRVVGMIGDGVNDSPVFKSASISIAIEKGTDITKTAADVIFLNNRLSNIQTLIGTSHKTVRIMRQNLFWALGYNTAILPLAVCGFVVPYIAVIGMTASSLIVLSNSLRLLKSRKTEKQGLLKQ
ncbi:heavy metal translocating P-type ATPase [Algicola sagamiensis]|uniref:heavy metal translocating P-type ATPase n=1 Tax=Algicola sagamiensis TaxID=163869 RepID=UPI000366120C|nr:heavy metal translocating P-type ATPase [Algicola sagamiensis]